MEKKSLIRRAIYSLDRFFFTENRSLNLGLLRITLIFLSLYHFRPRYPMDGYTFINEQLALVQRPGILLELLGVPFPLQPQHISIFLAVYYTAALCALIGLATRPALLTFSLCTIYLTDISVSRGFFNHEASLTTQVLLILAFAPGSTRFSADKILVWLAKERTKTSKSFLRALIGGPAPVWGFKTILILLACTYFTAGLSKIRYGSLEWLDGQTLTHYLDGSARASGTEASPMFIGPKNIPEAEKWKDGYGIYSYTYGNRQSSPSLIAIGEALASNATAIAAVSVATVAFELCGFLILLSGWPRVLYLLSAIVMHKSIGALMNLAFVEYQLICFYLIDWQWVYQHLNSRLKRRLDPFVAKASGLFA